MAQRFFTTDWLQVGKDVILDVILDLLSERFVVPWFEAESRISSFGWKSFPKVQPLQLHEARDSLVNSGLIVLEHTNHPVSVVTIRLPFPPNREREITRLRGSRRKLYRKYLSWSNDQKLCGKHAELVVFDSLKAVASDAGLYVPPQVPDAIKEVNAIEVHPGPLDAFAYILKLPDLGLDATLVVEVKNINDWIYPWTKELWELLVKAANLATHISILPILVCMRWAYPTSNMAKDIGFFVIQTQNQLFSPLIPEDEFKEVIDDFCLTITQHQGPLTEIENFFIKPFRQSPPPTPPLGEDIPWYKRQADRFQAMSSTILSFQNLADNVPGDVRANMFRAFRAASLSSLPWPPVKSW